MQNKMLQSAVMLTIKPVRRNLHTQKIRGMNVKKYNYFPESNVVERSSNLQTYVY